MYLVGKASSSYFLHIVIICSVFLPSSFVLSTLTELFGPSPTDVKANTSNSYSVYLSSPVTSLVNVDTVLIDTVVDDPAESFFW